MTDSRWARLARRLSPWQEFLLVFAVTSLPNLLAAVVHFVRGDRTFLMTASTGTYVSSIAMQVIAAAVLVPILLARGWTTGLGRPFPGARDLLPALGMWIGALSAALVVHLVVRAFHGGHLPAPFKVSITAIPAAAIAMVLVDPLYEEVLWLGYWVRRLEGRGVVLAMSVSIALRTAAHAYQGVTALLSILPIGIVWTIYYRRTHRLWPIVLAHVAQDMMATVLVLSGH